MFIASIFFFLSCNLWFISTFTLIFYHLYLLTLLLFIFHSFFFCLWILISFVSCVEFYFFSVRKSSRRTGGAGRSVAGVRLTFAVVRRRGQRPGPHDPLEAAHDGSPCAAAVTGGGGLLRCKEQGYYLLPMAVLSSLR